MVSPVPASRVAAGRLSRGSGGYDYRFRQEGSESIFGEHAHLHRFPHEHGKEKSWDTAFCAMMKCWGPAVVEYTSQRLAWALNDHHAIMWARNGRHVLMKERNAITIPGAFFHEITVVSESVESLCTRWSEPLEVEVIMHCRIWIEPRSLGTRQIHMAALGRLIWRHSADSYGASLLFYGGDMACYRD